MFIHKFFNLFIIYCMMLICPLFLFTFLNNELGRLDRENTQKMDAAVYSAMQETEVENGKAFGTEHQRIIVLNSFYGALASAFGDTNSNASLLRPASAVPCVILADTDGVYACYGKEYLSWNGDRETYRVTPITTYSAVYQSGNHRYGVTFFMDGTLSVQENGLTLAEGSRESVQRLLQRLSESDVPGMKDSLRALCFLETEEQYAMEKNAVIKNTILRTATYYLNEERFNPSGAYYQINQLDSQALVAPMLLSFFQNSQLRIWDNLSGKCIMSGAFLGRPLYYFISEEHSGIKIYHSNPVCEALDTDDTNRRYLLEEAANAGAYPCSECIR